MKTALTIAGSDSGGGAGIQADLRTFAAHDVFGASVITAVTAQNPRCVSRIDGLPAESVRSQIRTVREALMIHAVKTGMLFSAEIIAAVADELESLDCPLVIDPVMISTSGTRLLRDDALALFRERMLPLADCVTPNIPEAEFLTGLKIDSTGSAVAAAEKIAKDWQTNVVLKGGHAEQEEQAADVIYHAGGGMVYALSAPRLKLPPLTAHGTGCTFSAVLAACLAKGEAVESALISAKAFVLGSLAESRTIGTGLRGMFPPSDPAVYREQIQVRSL